MVKREIWRAHLNWTSTAMEVTRRQRLDGGNHGGDKKAAVDSGGYGG